MEVVNEGVLEIGTNPESTSSRDWKPRLCVLKQYVDARRSTLDLYKDTKKRWQKQTAKGVLSLWPTFQLSLAHECSYQYPMKLVTADKQVYYLAAKTYQAMNKWYNSIQSQWILEPVQKGYPEYLVTAEPSVSTSLIGAIGSCLLTFTPQNCIICSQPSTRRVLGVWPYNCLRRYSCGENAFSFEAGRRSPRGEGNFVFVTDRGEAIYWKLEKLIKRAKRGGSTSSGTESGGSPTSIRPPAPLPADFTRSETPVKTSDSSDDEKGRHPDLPPKLPRRSTLGTLGADNSGDRDETTQVSNAISPAYQIRRVKTHSGSGSGTPPTHKWLHESVERESPIQERYLKEKRMSRSRQEPLPPPPCALGGDDIKVADPLTEDTYSHTVHHIPESFKRNSSASAVGPTMYNALMHAAPTSPTACDQKTSSSKPESETDPSLYDVAFPANSSKLKSAQEGDYGSLGDANEQRKELEAKKLISVSVACKMPQGVRTSDGSSRPALGQRSAEATDSPPIEMRKDFSAQISSDGLTVNPLYGTKGDVLAGSELLSAVSVVERQAAEGSPQVYRGPQDLSTMGPPIGETPVSPLESSMVANPMYGGHQDLGIIRQRECELEESLSSESGTKLYGGSSSTSVDTAPEIGNKSVTVESAGDKGDKVDGGEIGGKESDSAAADGIVRDSKGYSKVDKSKKQDSPSKDHSADGSGDCNDANEQGQGENGDGSPPPIPARKYSMEGVADTSNVSSS